MNFYINYDLRPSTKLLFSNRKLLAPAAFVIELTPHKRLTQFRVVVEVV